MQMRQDRLGRCTRKTDTNALLHVLLATIILIIHVIGPARCNPHAAMPNKDSATFLLGMMDLRAGNMYVSPKGGVRRATRGMFGNCDLD